MIYSQSTVPPRVPCVLWDNVFLKGTVTVGQETTDGAGLNSLTGTTHDYWIPNTVPANIYVTLSEAVYVDCVGVAAHNLGSKGCTISVGYGGTIGTGGWTDLIEVTPDDDTSIVGYFPRVKSNIFRFRVESGPVPSIGAIFLGERLRFESGILPSYTPTNFSGNVELLSNTSRNGHFMGNKVIKRGGSTNVQFNIFDRDFVELDEGFKGFLNHYNDGESFFFCGNPYELPNDVGFCRRAEGGEMKPTFSSSMFYDCSMSLEVYLE